MKTVTRYEVRTIYGELLLSTDNMFVAYEYYDNFTTPLTASIHEITTTERDITDNARVENVSEEERETWDSIRKKLGRFVTDAEFNAIKKFYTDYNIPLPKIS